MVYLCRKGRASSSEYRRNAAIVAASMQHILAIDQGTTGTTVLILDEQLSIRGRGYCEFAQIYPQPGWVEHEPRAIMDSVFEALRAALQQSAVATSDLAAVGITNQRETVVLWDRKTGEPVYNAIVWQDRRTSDVCQELIAAGQQDAVRAATGLPIDPYFSATKLAWILDQGDLRKRAERGELAFGTIDCYLVWQLTNGKRHVTDVSNASRTLLFDIHKMAWSDALLEQFRIPRAVLPEVAPSAGEFGKLEGLTKLPDGLPISGMAGDQQAALFGQACFAAGDAKCTYGTGAFLLMNTGSVAVPSTHGLVTTVAWQISGELAYALEGSAFIAGAAVQWLRDELQFFNNADEIEALANSVPDSGGVVVVPAFAGLGAPHWRPNARGTITGLTRGTTRAHLARATLEGIALQNVDILRAMERDSERSLSVLKVDGGAAANNLLMQFQSDVLGVAITRPQILETTAVGAALLAGLGCGLWSSKIAIEKALPEDRSFQPSMSNEAVQEHLARWNLAVRNA
ncbi:MAG: glycerol kinase [Planctomycetota bacterium]|jgi:glycerol kinase